MIWLLQFEPPFRETSHLIRFTSEFLTTLPLCRPRRTLCQASLARPTDLTTRRRNVGSAVDASKSFYGMADLARQPPPCVRQEVQQVQRCGVPIGQVLSHQVAGQAMQMRAELRGLERCHSL